MADDDNPATAGAELGRQEVEPIAVEVIGWLIQQDEVMVCAEEAGEAHSIPLTHRERRELTGWVRLRSESFKRNLHTPLSVPGIKCLCRL